MFDEEVERLAKRLIRGDIDLFVDADDENEVSRVAEMFNEDVGPLVNSLNTEDVDLFVNADNEDKV